MDEATKLIGEITRTDGWQDTYTLKLIQYVQRCENPKSEWDRIRAACRRHGLHGAAKAKYIFGAFRSAAVERGKKV